MREDFVEREKFRKLTNLEISRRTKGDPSPDGLTSLEMRINKIEIDKTNLVTIKLIFKLDHYPEISNDVYTLFLIHTISVYDTNRIFEKDPLNDLSIGYMAMHYKESGERLFEELLTQAKQMNMPLTGTYAISDEEAEQQVELIMSAYFQSR